MLFAIQTIAVVLTLIVVAWYSYLTWRMQREVKRQADTATANYETYKLTIAAEWLLKLSEQFDSRKYMHDRVMAAQYLVDGKHGLELDNVWDFFETLGLFVRRQIVDEEMVWSAFCYWINGYWQTSEVMIQERRKDDPELWVDFEYLFHAVQRVERAHNPSSNEVTLSEVKRNKFLGHELSLRRLLRPFPTEVP